MLSELRQLATRYERLYFGSDTQLKRSVREHRRIRKHVAAGRVDEAAGALREHWARCRDVVLELLDDEIEGSK